MNTCSACGITRWDAEGTEDIYEYERFGMAWDSSGSGLWSGWMVHWGGTGMEWEHMRTILWKGWWWGGQDWRKGCQMTTSKIYQKSEWLSERKRQTRAGISWNEMPEQREQKMPLPWPLGGSSHVGRGYWKCRFNYLHQAFHQPWVVWRLFSFDLSVPTTCLHQIHQR